MAGVIALLVPSLLTALVVTQTFGEDQRLVLDEKAVGVAVGRFASAHGLGHAYFLLCLLPNLAAHVIGIVTSCQSASSR
jgi:hypothetical protein